MGQVGYTAAQHEGVSAGMMGCDWEREGEEESKDERPPPPPKGKSPPPQPPATKKGCKKISRMDCELDDSSDGPPPPKKKVPPPKAAPCHKGHPHPQDKSPPKRGSRMVSTTQVSAPRSTSRTHGERRWAPFMVSTGGRRALFGRSTHTMPNSTRLPATSSSPPVRPPMNTLSVFARARSPPPRLTFGPTRPKD